MKELEDNIKKEILIRLNDILNIEYPSYKEFVKIEFIRKLDLIEVSKGLYTLSDEDSKLIHNENKTIWRKRE